MNFVLDFTESPAVRWGWVVITGMKIQPESLLLKYLYSNMKFVLFAIFSLD